uniref:Uncharacterized protein n=1 Tax=Anguilla anguilla TaxID=7936 RepID=A0A0E9PG11_ANGAN
MLNTQRRTYEQHFVNMLLYFLWRGKRSHMINRLFHNLIFLKQNVRV